MKQQVSWKVRPFFFSGSQCVCFRGVKRCQLLRISCILRCHDRQLRWGNCWRGMRGQQKCLDELLDNPMTCFSG